MRLPNLFNINDQSILATASITITDQTDAATLLGGISIVSGTKNQVYINGSTTPYSPDWTKNKLVLRPYLYANSVDRGQGTSNVYNPDFFDPNEYPDLDNPGDPNVYTPYINKDTIAWYVRDANGAERIINPNEDSRFIFNYTTADGKLFTDKRYLVIRDNIVPMNSFLTIICKFSFYDPFAKIHINQNFEIDLSCLSTGRGANQLLINSVNGTSIYNSAPEFIDLYASFYKDGVEIDVDEEVKATDKASTLHWFIRSSDGRGWTLLDGEKQDEDTKNLFEIHHKLNYDPVNGIYTTDISNNARGGFWLRIHPALIQGSDVIKAKYYSSDEKKEYTALEVVYDTTDDVQAYIYSSNGDKIYQGIQSIGTVLTCMLKYQGKVLETDNPKYETDFEYYWFKVSSDGSETWNIWIDSMGQLMQQKLISDGSSVVEMIPSSRILPINAEHVDNVNMFQCAVVDKVATSLAEQRSLLFLNNPTEDDLKAASNVNKDLGIDEDDIEALLKTAYEINAFNISKK